MMRDHADVQTRFPQTERDGWSELVTDAQAGAGVCLEQYALETGLTMAEASSRILTARSVYRQAYGAATGRLTALRDQADALYRAGDVEGLKNIQKEEMT